MSNFSGETNNENKAVVTYPQPNIELCEISSKPMMLLPKTFDEIYRLARIISASGLAPRGIERPETVFVAIQMGLELGLSPTQALQNIAVINGRPCVWGDAMLAIVMTSEFFEYIKETTEGEGDKMKAICTVKRKGKDPITHYFSVEDAKRTGKWGKDIWAKYPRRMLQMRSRSYALRDAFPDLLKGMKTVEEARDTDYDVIDVTDHKDISELNNMLDEEQNQPDSESGKQQADVKYTSVKKPQETALNKSKEISGHEQEKQDDLPFDPNDVVTEQPLSFTEEYKLMKESKNLHPELYEKAVKKYGKPVNVEMCKEIHEFISTEVDRANDRDQN